MYKEKARTVPKIRVFLVDDHPVVREGIRLLLSTDDTILITGKAATAEEALSKIQSSSPQVVLMDIRLPGISGVEATRQLKEQYPDLRVVILSGFNHEYLAQAIEAGADGYVLKTSSPSELVNAVKQAANGQPPIDSNLTAELLGQFAQLSRLSRSQGLTQRQLAILRGVSQGVPSKEIAAQLAISDATFKRDMRNIFNFFVVNDRAQAVAETYRRNLL